MAGYAHYDHIDQDQNHCRIRNESSEVQADVAIKLDRIKALLANNSKQAQTWGHVASLEKVSSDLDELIDFLK